MWTRRALLFLPVAALALAANPAAAATSVAVLPAHVSRGAVDNGPVITMALRRNLQSGGIIVISAETTEAGLRRADLKLSDPLSAEKLAALRASLEVDYVVYPRVLGVGVGVNANRASATVLVNVAGASKSGFAHTRQVGQPFGPENINADAAARAVIDAEAAAHLAKALLAGFYERLKKTTK